MARHLLGVELHAGRDVYGEQYLLLSASVDVMQDWMKPSVNNLSAAADTDVSTDILLDMEITCSMIKTIVATGRKGISRTGM
jgi:hypothetical protein